MSYTKKYFGTDGIRGNSNCFPMTAEVALKVGMAVGAKFTNGEHRHRVVIGKDTRLSGYMIESALVAGFLSVGMDVFLVGPVPTPAVSMLTRSLRADIGIMISASHNPYHDNGIKIFNYLGHKLDDQIEKEIETMIDSDHSHYLVSPQNLGRAKRIDDAKGRYIEFVKNSFPKDQNLENLKIVIDAANGAAYSIASTILLELGAKVIAIGIEPNGFNINEGCGSTNPKLLCQEVLKHNADIGIALDGDADRLLIVDEKGKVVAGDKLIGLIAEKLHSEGNLKRDTVIVTQMSNLALEDYLNYHGIAMVRTGVGDRYVLEEMKKRKCNFGAEQSGHIVLSDYSASGDGMIAALQVLSIVGSRRKPVSEITDIFDLMPQILKNVTYQSSEPFENKELLEEIRIAESELGKDGRVLVRKSGTEKLIRVMVEGQNLNQINVISERIAKKIS